MDNFDLPTNATVYGWRSWLYLLLNPILGTVYFGLLSAGFAVSFALSFIWIGLPLLAVMLSLTRRIAHMDRWLAAKMIGMQLAQIPDDLQLRNANPLHMIGAHLTSATSWQSAVYLFVKFPLGMVSMMMAMMVFPFLALETVLRVIGINTGMFSGRVIRAMAAGLSGTVGGLTPAVEDEPERYVDVPHYQTVSKAKQRLADDYYDNGEYFIDDDGEIAVAQRKRK
ncbi:MAG: sensor domain-containing protein [Armatimonadetes bacterium]|nr:sensor domain-containing protein [Anaerolineae bacterium]